VLFPPYLPFWFYPLLDPQNRPQGVIPPTLRTTDLKFLDKKAEEDNINLFTNKHIQQLGLQALALQQAV